MQLAIFRLLNINFFIDVIEYKLAYVHANKYIHNSLGLNTKFARFMYQRVHRLSSS